MQRSFTIPTVAPTNLSWVPSTRTRVNNASKFHSYHSYANITNGSCGTFSIPQGILHTKTISKHTRTVRVIPANTFIHYPTVFRQETPKKLLTNCHADDHACGSREFAYFTDWIFWEKEPTHGLLVWLRALHLFASSFEISFRNHGRRQRIFLLCVFPHSRFQNVMFSLCIKHRTRSSVHACHQLKKGVSSCTRCHRK